jgi:hypothetical protein
VVEARFIEVVADQRVVQAVDFESDDPGFAGTMTMTWAVDSVRARTRVRITAADVPAGISAEEHGEDPRAPQQERGESDPSDADPIPVAMSHRGLLPVLAQCLE